MTIGEIEYIICKELKLATWELHEKTREAAIKEARQIIMYFAIIFDCGTQRKIEGYFGLRHPMAWHSRNVINNLIDTNKRFAQQIKDYKRRLDIFDGTINVDDLDNEIAIVKERLAKLVNLRFEIKISVL